MNPRTEKSQESPWWQAGVRFECQGSGQCCVSRGEYGYVFLTIEDRQRLAKKLRLRTTEFTKKFCQKFKGAYHLTEKPGVTECMFLNGNRCTVYSARPSQCRTWPFWPDVLSAKTWKKEVASYCPGVGKGPLIEAKVIRQKMAEQQRTDDMVVSEATRHLKKEGRYRS